MKNLIFLTLILLLMYSCKEQSYQKAVDEATTVKLYTLAATPVQKESQTAGKVYVADYEVLQEIPLSEAQQSMLKEKALALKDATVPPARRCPFQGKYALQFDGKISLVFSTSPCNKMTVSDAGKPHHLDLTDKTDLPQILASLPGQ